MPNQGYIRTTSFGDTILNTTNCKMLESVKINSSGQVSSIDTIFMYSDSGKVYHYRSGSFYLLYDFTLNPGDSWQTIAPYPSPFTISGNPPDTIVQIVVDSVSTITISGISKKVMYVHSNFNDWLFLNPIIEDIGSAGGLFPFIYDWMDFEIPLLRCYSDSILIYDAEPNYPCDTLVNKVNEATDFSTPIFITPNPADQNINLHIPDDGKIERFVIYNEFGKMVYQHNLENSTKEIFTGSFPDGIYFARAFKKNEVTSIKIVISHE